MKKFLSRKFVMALVVLVIVIVLLVSGKIQENTFKDLLIWICNGYLLTNVAAKFKK